MANIGVWELMVLFLIVLLFFGAKRIPDVAKALGKASREFKKARDGVIEELEKEPEIKESSQDRVKTEQSGDAEK